MQEYCCMEPNLAISDIITRLLRGILLQREAEENKTGWSENLEQA